MIHSIWDGHTNALMCRLTRVISSPLCLCLVKKHHSTINDHIIFFNQKVFSVFLFLHKILVYYTEQAARPYYVSRYQAWKHASHVTFYGGSCAGLARK